MRRVCAPVWAPRALPVCAPVTPLSLDRFLSRVVRNVPLQHCVRIVCAFFGGEVLSRRTVLYNVACSALLSLGGRARCHYSWLGSTRYMSRTVRRSGAVTPIASK